MFFNQVKQFHIKLLLLGVVLFAPVISHATHLRAGEITVQRVSCTSRDYEICITVYTNTGSEIKFGDGVLDFGDGSKAHITPSIDNTLRPDLGPNVGTVTYCINHTYSGPGKYIISYGENNRNAGILNIANSVETKFYVETIINIDPLLGCSNSPLLLVPPIDKACTGATWYHNPGAFDPDGDSISFEMSIPLKDKGQLVNNYRAPNTREFYDRIGLDYSNSNEDQSGPPTFSINAITGTLVWDAPGAPGEYNISFLVKEWRKIGDTWVLLGYVTRDMQIVVEDCDNQRPELEVPEDICVEAGTIINQDIFATDLDQDSVVIEAYSQVFGINPSPATWVPNPAEPQATSGLNQAKLLFSWATTCEHIKDQPYQVVFKVTDNPPQGPKLVQFKTWNIRVVGPPPKWKDIQVDLAKRSAQLTWDNYTCKNAETIQIWRRVDQFVFNPPECVTGMPDFLGFTKIAEVPANTTQFTDRNGGKGLAVGAAYCYRLVAAFPLPGGGESYVSKDTCLLPIQADAPVITNVSIDRTDQTDGQITVKWRSPFDIDKAQYPPPYSYEVYRAEGFSGIKSSIKARGRSADSVFVDTKLNSEETVFNYTIYLFDKNNISVDTSFTASTVRLETKSKVKQIELSWNADVPWSNLAQDYPLHLIYRGGANATEDQMELIGSVNVNEKMFHYIDSGQYNSTPLKETEVYCYRVMTRGVYGNPKINEPLENFSQIICAQPNDSEPPCAPEFAVELEGIDCTNYLESNVCGQNIFSNVIFWNRPSDPICRADVKSYNIYVANTSLDTFSIQTPYAVNVRDTFFIDANLPSFARCYKIAAVDRSGNVSPLSEKFCFDNCPNYELPNVFTPNGDACNEVFSAFSDRAVIDESGNGACGKINEEDQKKHCARFVEKVEFIVFNRWGKEVYRYNSGGERSIYIDWDGRDNNSRELSAGVYYYNANVTFDVVDPSQKKKSIKGWVHLIR
ncbi:MAG: gliding motility-associated C-terminal domain-containing protein [Bacteroidia bacterium]|nr:gliding motility-associated C-terminal domain-containing protein [Bacteroidia bacterium]